MNKTLAILLPAVALLCGCKREEREFHADNSMAEPASSIQLTDVTAGGPPNTQPALNLISFENPNEQNAYQLSEGKRLYEQFNCVTCHAHGGGDIGPALKDDKWIYGASPAQVYASIAQGRPNGMPAFGSKLNRQQCWQLSAYVRSLSGQVSSNAAPGRDDHMNTGVPENTVQPATPKQTATPPAAEKPQ